MLTLPGRSIRSHSRRRPGREPRSALPSGSRLRPVCDARIGGIGEVNGESKMKVDRSEDMRRLTEAMR